LKILIFCSLVLALTCSLSFANTLTLECRNIKTNPYAEEQDLSPYYFHLDFDNQKISKSLTGDGYKSNLQTLFWTNKFIGAVNGGTELFAAVSSYLFDRHQGTLLWTQISDTEMNEEYRKGMHSVAKMTGTIRGIYMRCGKVGGF